MRVYIAGLPDGCMVINSETQEEMGVFYYVSDAKEWVRVMEYELVDSPQD